METIKTWQERVGENYNDSAEETAHETAMLAHIADLEAALAQRAVSEAVPVQVVDGWKSIISDWECGFIGADKCIREIEKLIDAAPPAAPVAWDADATHLLHSIVALLEIPYIGSASDMTGHEFAVLGFVLREIERLKTAAPVALSDAAGEIEAFEAWYHAPDESGLSFPSEYTECKEPDGKYTYNFVQTRWVGWQARAILAAATQPTVADKQNALLSRPVLEAAAKAVADSATVWTGFAMLDAKTCIDAAIAASAKEK